MTIGRNDPCPCGSGKKYKKCCLETAEKATSEVLLLNHRLTKCYEKLEGHLGKYARRVFGQDGPVLALDEFFGWFDVDEPLTEEFIDRQGALFWPWFLFNWEYEKDESGEFDLDVPPGKTVADLYAEKQGQKLDDLERKLIQAINRKPYSFWEVMGVDPGNTIDLQDVFTGVRITAQERTGSQCVEPADIVFARVVLIDGVGMVIGVGSTILPPAGKVRVIALRRSIRGKRRKLTDGDVYDWNAEIRNLYFELEEDLYQPPELDDTDGGLEPIDILDTDDDVAAFNQDPEFQRQLAETVATHWECWLEMKIPALGNITPRKAMKTADGREAVQALLLDAEQTIGLDPQLDRYNREGVHRVRQALGLAVSGNNQ